MPELDGLIDAVCVSLNADDSDRYRKICQPHFDGDVHQAVVDFIVEAKKVIPEVIATYVDAPGVDVEAMEKSIAALGVESRRRHYNRLG